MLVTLTATQVNRPPRTPMEMPRAISRFTRSPLPGSGDEDCPAADSARGQVVDGLLEVVERVLGGVQPDLALSRQRHELDQVVVGADQVADDVLLRGDEVDGRDDDVLPVADDVV